MGNLDTIIISGKKYDELSILKEKEEYVRLEAVGLCFALSRLVHDSSALVRAAVARKKVGHEFLVNDKSWRVRATVAKYTNDTRILHELLDDNNDFVRFIIAKRGCKLDFFVNDKDEEIASLARYQLQQNKVVG